MGKLQKVKVTLRESERWFRAIFNQTFGFIGLMQLMGILIEGNQTALKFGVITSSKIRCPLWEACWSDFSRDVEGLSPIRREALNFRLTLVGKLAQALGILLVVSHYVKSQVQWWTISLQSVITRSSKWWTHGLKVRSFSDQSQKVIFLIQKSWQRLGILSKIREKVLLIFQTVEDCDRQEDTSTGLASVKKNVKISRGKITSDSQIAMGSSLLIYLL